MKKRALEIAHLGNDRFAEEAFPAVENVTIYAAATRLVIARLECNRDRISVAYRAGVVVVGGQSRFRQKRATHIQVMYHFAHLIQFILAYVVLVCRQKCFVKRDETKASFLEGTLEKLYAYSSRA